MSSMMVVCKYFKYMESVFQSTEITLKDNKNFSSSHFIHICPCRARPETLLFDLIYIYIYIYIYTQYHFKCTTLNVRIIPLLCTNNVFYSSCTRRTILCYTVRILLWRHSNPLVSETHLIHALPLNATCFYQSCHLHIYNIISYCRWEAPWPRSGRNKRCSKPDGVHKSVWE